MTPIIKVSKLDCARRQMETAIELYFYGKDPVSTHTLTAAAYQLFRDLNGKRGGDPMLLDRANLESIAVEGRAADLYRLLTRAENFFKHADKDPEETFDFNPTNTLTLLWECTAKYSEMTSEQTMLMRALNGWFQLCHPDYLKPEWQQNVRLAAEHIKVEDGRMAFFTHFLEFYPRWLNLTGSAS